MNSQSKKPILSICIPTYNRATYLDKCLQSLMNQVIDRQNEVEIVICDNNSTDNTYDVVSKYIRDGVEIKYTKNSVNVHDKNFYIVINNANGIYRKLINDSTIFNEGSIDKILKTVKDNYVSRKPIVWTNSVNNGSINKELDFKSLILDCGFRLTSILWFGVWESDLSLLICDDDVFSTKIWQLYMTLAIVKKHQMAILYNQKLFTTQEVLKKDLTYGLFKVFHKNFFEILKPYFIFYNFNNCEVETIEKDLLYNFFMVWCINTEVYKYKYSVYHNENLFLEVKNYYKNKPYWADFYVKYKVKTLFQLLKSF